jgi:hypothetical protein
MVMPVENDRAERDAIWTALNQAAPPGSQLKNDQAYVGLKCIFDCI